MSPDLERLDVRTRKQWRAWLAKHHATSAGVWVVCHKQHSGVESIDYKDLLCEALCFGWIDSLIKRLDDDRYLRKVTPRKPTSNWSDINRKLWAELKARGLLAAPGLAAAPTENRYAKRPEIPELPTYIAKALRANAKAWAFFQKLTRREQRHFVVWIHIAKREETRAKRLRESLALLARGERLGLK